ncbi:2-oxoglutarate and iron-dependent oxygenase JMJD4 isoform X3 [Anabrus simplex]|uniref:2-oxoglutarate and iron-dependent oxygenase JMJD4 isoform X3 n=1 Tax=Anabrus simplex TaxID=316456 RepID=UPI0035A32EED
MVGKRAYHYNENSLTQSSYEKRRLVISPSRFQGQVEVPVANCGEKYYNVHKKSTMLLSDYLNYWKNYIDQGYPDNIPCLYMKDWHFTRDFPQEQVYRVPHYFASDWLNEYFSSKTSILDDYRFIYMGPKGSWTPLHADVFMSFSWSINVCGRKRWLLFPPGQEDYLCDRFGKLAYDATLPEMKDEKLYPEYAHLTSSYEVIQEAGEAIFVPSGWHHQVWNMEDTISINHNWVNGCNIEAMLNSLQTNLAAVKKEVDDCRDMEEWEEHCQLILRASYGIDYEEFYTFLHCIVTKRLDYFLHEKPVMLFGGWLLGKEHILFDIKQLQKVLQLFLTDSDTIKLKFFKNLGSDHENLIEEIDSVISKMSSTES